jgi:type I restriction enzyme R subunit
LNSLVKKLSKKPQDLIYISDDIALEYYRSKKAFEVSIPPNQTGGEQLYGMQYSSNESIKEEKERLYPIIDRINERFDTALTQ